MTDMRKFGLAALLMALAASALAGPPSPFTAHYEVEFSGLGGELTSTFAPADGGGYVFENRTRARGLARMVRPRDAVDRSEFTALGSNLTPRHYTSEDGSRRNKRGSVIDFDWTAGTATATYRKESRNIELTDGMLDRQLMQIAMMRDLAAGVRTASYTVIDRHNVKRYDIETLDEETIAVPAGEFHTLRVERRRPGSSRSTLLWCAPELDYLPVLMQQLKDGEVIATLRLTAVE